MDEDKQSKPRKVGRPTKAEAESERLQRTPDDEFMEQLMLEPVKTERVKLLNLDEPTLKTIAALAKLFCTQEEIAGVLGCSLSTFSHFLRENPRAKDVWEDGLKHAKISLRRKQLAMADKSAPVAIFLGKNYLGQKDEHHNTNTNVSVPANEMTEADLLLVAQGGLPRSHGKEVSKLEVSKKVH